LLVFSAMVALLPVLGEPAEATSTAFTLIRDAKLEAGLIAPAASPKETACRSHGADRDHAAVLLLACWINQTADDRVPHVVTGDCVVQSRPAPPSQARAPPVLSA
jgi:hypothetical protein